MADTVIRIHLKATKETKGTYVYGTDDDTAAVSSLYIKKAAFKDGAPKAISVTITPA